MRKLEEQKCMSILQITFPKFIPYWEADAFEREEDGGFMALMELFLNKETASHKLPMTVGIGPYAQRML